jgi:hypothetical protein
MLLGPDFVFVFVFWYWLLEDLLLAWNELNRSKTLILFLVFEASFTDSSSPERRVDLGT